MSAEPHLTLATLGLGLTWFVVFLFSTTLHEAAHAFAAYRLGDPTAYHGGQVTLNPLPHIRREPVGMVAIPLITFFTRGWMMGWASAPYDPAWARRFPRRAAVMALAGPAANLLLVLAAGVAIRGGMAGGIFRPPERVSFTQVTASVDGGPWGGVVGPLSLLFSLNLLLCIFNLLPLPPLDGSAVIPALLPSQAAERYAALINQPFMSLLGLVVAWQLFNPIYYPVQLAALRLLYPGVSYG
ncbi:MAG TPA: site-2 protease family protein [Thermoanaerobaculia bacterium]|nr:site-2 protease family protein [Thermoanaerobaculia bacterium]